MEGSWAWALEGPRAWAEAGRGPAPAPRTAASMASAIRGDLDIRPANSGTLSELRPEGERCPAAATVPAATTGPDARLDFGGKSPLRPGHRVRLVGRLRCLFSLSILIS